MAIIEAFPNCQLIKAHKVIVKQFYGNFTEFNKANPPQKGIVPFLVEFIKSTQNPTKGNENDSKQ